MLIKTFGDGMTWREQINNRKRALNTDLFITGTNTITSDGHVVILVGVNKIVDTLNNAMIRVKKIAAPYNAKQRSEFTLPCQKTGECCDCDNSYRLCNTWMISEKSYPKERIKIILINEELGF